MKKLALLSVLAPFILACATTPTLKDYQPKSPEEKQIASLFLDLQNAVNTYNREKARPLYSPDAKVWTVEKMDRSYTKRMYTMEQLKTHGAKLYRAMERASLNITFFPPKNIYVEGDAACMTCPYKVVSRNPRIPYVERGIYYTEFSKGGTGWRISLTEWQIEYCNDAKWQEYKRKHENQNHLGNPRYLQPEAETVKREATLESRSIHIQR